MGASGRCNPLTSLVDSSWPEKGKFLVAPAPNQMAVALVANSKLRVGHRVLPPPLPAPAAAGTQLWRRPAAWTPVFIGTEEKSSSSVSAYSGRKMIHKEVAALCCHRGTAPGGSKDDTKEEDSPLVGGPAASEAESPWEASPSTSGGSASSSTTTSFSSSSSAPSAGPMSMPGKRNNDHIIWSDVEVRRRRKVYWGRQWNALDVGTAGVVVSMHALCLFAPWAFTWGALWTAMGLYLVTGLLGITLSFHRNLSHRSFRLPKWLEYTFAYCGVQALQGNPLDWVSTHRYHHQHCDSDRDPHSTLEGFWFSHMSWIFDTASVVQRCGESNNVGDLEKQPFYRFLRSTYAVHPIALAALLYALGGFPYLVWGMGVRIVWVYHVTWLVNSACHVWGQQPWNTGDLSRNNWWVAVLAFGEGWHNNHHAFEYSARHGLEWWQLDVTWYVVRLLQSLGLATDVRLPRRAHLLEKKTTTTMV